MLQDPRNLADLLAEASPEIAARFEFDRAELLDREFLLEDWRRRESDLLYRVPFREEPESEPALVCVLLEHQSAPDPLMPLRLLVYMTLFWDRQWKEWEQLPAPKETPAAESLVALCLSYWDKCMEIAAYLGGPHFRPCVAGVLCASV
jgi:hypothetical protein